MLIENKTKQVLIFVRDTDTDPPGDTDGIFLDPGINYVMPEDVAAYGRYLLSCLDNEDIAVISDNPSPPATGELVVITNNGHRFRGWENKQQPALLN